MTLGGALYELNIMCNSPEIPIYFKPVIEKIIETIQMDAQEVRHGEWIWDNRCGLYTCSECGALSPRENQDGEYIDRPAYCHECGAKMTGGADG